MPTYSYVLAASGAAATGAAALAGLAHEPDHEGVGLARIIQQYVPAVRLRAILATLLNGEATVGGGGLAPTGVQAIEDLAWQLYTERDLIEVEGGGPAVGEQLDVIGRIVGLARLDAFGGSDDIYRMALAIKIRINKTDGSPDDILGIISLLEDMMAFFGGVATTSKIVEYPWSFATEMMPIDAAFIEAIWPILKKAKPAGWRWDLHWLDSLEEDVYQYSSQLAVEEMDITRGYGDLTLPNPATGGRYMGLMT